MTTSNTPKINVRNSVSECAQSLRKENAGKYQNYAIKDCIACGSRNISLRTKIIVRRLAQNKRQ